MRRSPAVVDRKAIAEHAWHDETDPLGSNAIDVQLSRLRAKLPTPASGSSRSAAPATGWRRRDRRRRRHDPRRPHELDPGRPRRDRDRRVVYLAIVASPCSRSSRSDLTGQIDRRLADTLVHITHGRPPPGPRLRRAARRRPRFGSPCSSGRSRRTARVTRTRRRAMLPDGYAASPVRPTVTIGDAQVRVMGAPTGDGYVVVGQTIGRRLAGTDHAPPGRADHRADAAARRVPGRGRHRAAGRGADRARASAPARVHRRRLARAAHAAVGHRGAHQPRPRAGARRRTWYRTAFGRIDRESQRMRRLVEDLLWLARFDATHGSRRRRAGRPRRARRADGRSVRGSSRRPASSRLDSSPSRATTSSRCRRSGSTGCSACCSTTPASTPRKAARSRSRSAGDGGRVRLTVDDAGPGHPRGPSGPDLRPLPSATGRHGRRSGPRPRHRRRDRARHERPLADRRIRRRRRLHVRGLEARAGANGSSTN